MEKQPASRKTGDSILIVENEVVLAEDLLLTLQELGYKKCERVSTGEAAVSKVSGGGIGIVLMDIKLDGRMDGIDAAEQINASTDIPIVYLTAFSDESVLRRAKQTLPCGYLLKPFRSNELKAAIEMAFYRAKTQREQQAQDDAPICNGKRIVAADPFLVICAHCKQVRPRNNSWDTIEEYLHSRFAVQCSHSVCPQCARQYYPEFELYK
jgi:two-component system, response regulator PdtaR